jgi:chromate transport protein ChrA
MLIELMKGIGIFYYWTWFIWPFVLILSLISSISAATKDENTSLASGITAAVSLLIILAGVVSPTFS